MIATRIFLALSAIALGAFGIWFLASPLAAAARLGLEISGPNASYEIRGIYGGVSLGLALLAAAGVVRAALARPALWSLAAYFGGYTLSRLLSLAIGERPSGAFIAYTVFELTMFVAGVLALRNAREPR